ncbi:MAG: hypothetical protein IPK80_15170 [Nannocystis sp.]|nr:hypothetical protein [Nannocystis sp.]
MKNDIQINDLRDRKIFDAVCRMAQSGDRLDLNLITRSYVDMGHIDRLRTKTSQYIEGRRGTGKTHLLTYFAQDINSSLQTNRQIAVYIDARELLGETPEVSPPPKLYGQKLLRQLIIRIAHELRIIDEQYLFHNSIPIERTPFETSTLLQSHRILSDLQCAASDGTAIVAANGTATTQTKQQNKKSLRGALAASAKPLLDASLHASSELSEMATHLEERRYEFKTDHATIRQHLNEYLTLNDLGTLHVIIDEWSSLSANVQPHFAEYIKRCLFPLRSISVKIGVIPFQTHFHTSDEGEQIGFERNGDIFRALDLDEDLMYYGAKCVALKKSFTQLLIKHIAYNAEAAINPQGMTGDEDDYTCVDLSSIPQPATGAALDKLLLFSMGNPRDFINLFRRSFFEWHNSNSAQITVPNVEGAAKALGIEKMETMQSHGGGIFELFQTICGVVFYTKRTNAFLVRESRAGAYAFLALIHHRSLHVWDRSYSSPNHAGERFVVVSIDFCIIVEHLKSPNYRNVWASNAREIKQLGLFPSDDEPPTAEAHLNEDEAVRVLQTPDKRTARYVVLPDSVVGGSSHIVCGGCGEHFSAAHPIVTKFKSCPKCAEPLRVAALPGLAWHQT